MFGRAERSSSSEWLECSSPAAELGCWPGVYGGRDGRMRDIGFSAVVSLVDDVRVVFPDTVIIGAGLRGAQLPGVW